MPYGLRLVIDWLKQIERSEILLLVAERLQPSGSQLSPDTGPTHRFACQLLGQRQSRALCRYAQDANVGDIDRL